MPKPETPKKIMYYEFDLDKLELGQAVVILMDTIDRLFKPKIEESLRVHRAILDIMGSINK